MLQEPALSLLVCITLSVMNRISVLSLGREMFHTGNLESVSLLLFTRGYESLL